ncbi:hypothetical protein D0862_03905 [Hortaea werneckii]|uniref:Uncharacterized protein n=1 Tax=Hortaea werneckii TaxID=91943 RepID=A0A3M7H5V8_HORWE|nr:hypothetical protein D0862_03905 [Hortaea werneckii]
MEIASKPIFHPTTTTTTTNNNNKSCTCKILISPGHGAGWVTYAPRSAPDVFRAWMLTFEPLIVALERERKGNGGGGSGSGSDPSSPEEALSLFHHQARLRFNIDRLMLARVQDLFVLELPATQGAFEIREVEGRETVWDVSRRRDVVIPPPPPSMNAAAMPAVPAAGEHGGEEKVGVGKGVPVEMSAPLKGVGSTPAASAGSVASLGLSSSAGPGVGSGVGTSGGRGVK